MGHLTFKDRKRIAELLGLGKNTSYIAGVLECHPSTIGREIERGAVYDERTESRLMRSKRRPLYDPVTAQSNYRYEDGQSEKIKSAGRICDILSRPQDFSLARISESNRHRRNL